MKIKELKSAAELKDLQEYLKQFFPRSLYPFHVAKFTTDGYIPAKFGPRIFVDTWPRPVLVWASVWELSSHAIDRCTFTIFISDPFLNVDVKAFCTEIGNEMGLFTGNCKSIGFLIKEATLAERVIQSFHENTKTAFEILFENQITLWWLQPGNEHHKKLHETVQLPPDLYLSKLDESEADYVNSTWPHKAPGSEDHMRDKIRYLPNCCFRKKSDDSLVGWELTAFLGFGNHGFVIPERRGQGKAKQVERLGKRIIPHLWLPRGKHRFGFRPHLMWMWWFANPSQGRQNRNSKQKCLT